MGHLQENGFAIKANTISESQLEAIKDKYGVPQSLRTCHTGVVDGYIIEGHVPAQVVKRLLSERPALKGIGVAGMPIGSPGMEGGKPEAYDVLSFDNGGRLRLYQRVDPSRTGK